MTAAHAEILLDAHVHYQAGFTRALFFTAAVANLRAGAEQLGVTPTPRLGLMFTESHGADAFAEFAAEAEPRLPDGAQPERWFFLRTAEDNSLYAVKSAAPDESILLIAGRQIVTSDRLEVLALGCREPLPGGVELAAARDAVLEAGGVPVVPWGFGKWRAGRGRTVEALIDADSPGRWFLGDNSGRPKLGRRPPMFDRGAGRGVFTLPGSDPLPLAGQADKVGRCGFLMSGPFDPERPASSIIEWLRDCAEQPRTFGRYESLGNFARDQWAMQQRKRAAATSGAA